MKHIIYNLQDVPVSSYANLVLLNRVYSKLERRDWARTRRAFINAELAKSGKLICFYCGKNDLEFNSKDRSRKATLDHVIAKSSGGARYNRSNLVICCNSCNSKKSNSDKCNFLASKYLINKLKQSHIE